MGYCDTLPILDSNDSNKTWFFTSSFSEFICHTQCCKYLRDWRRVLASYILLIVSSRGRSIKAVRLYRILALQVNGSQVGKYNIVFFSFKGRTHEMHTVIIASRCCHYPPPRPYATQGQGHLGQGRFVQGKHCPLMIHCPPRDASSREKR
jgi:hypothetical protein